MKTIEQEAEEYFDNNIFCDGITPFEEDISKRCFIAGANSKWVQAEKIKVQIEAVKPYLEFSNTESFAKYDIEKLEQQLKQLEDETKV
jgi:hypothetical protein